MDLLERYLGAVRWNLPADKADDIIAELADLIAARIEDREEALDRPLSRTEISALLKEFGHPLAVAGQYHGQRALIGAEVFPFYWFVLRIVLAVIAAIEAVQMGGRIVVGQPLMRALWQGAADAGSSLLLNAALVTLAFAIVERTGWLDAYLAKWKPEELPDLGRLRLDLPPRKRWEPVFEIAFGIAFLLWWSGGFTIPFAPRDADVRITAAAVWTALYWPVVALVWGRIALNLLGLLRPGWKPLRAALILGCTVGWLAILAVLHQAPQIVTVIGANAQRAAQVQIGLDKGLGIAVIVAAAMTVFQCAKELWQLSRQRR